MKYRVHYMVDNYEDYYTLEAETLEDIIDMNEIERDSRGLDFVKNSMWSEYEEGTE